MKLVRVRNEDTRAETDVPESAVPMLRQSGWEPVSDDEAAQAERDRVAAIAADDRAMTQAGLAATPAPPENVPTDEEAD